MAESNFEPRVSLDRFRRVMEGKGLVITEGYLRDDFPLSNGAAALTTNTIKWSLTSASGGTPPSQAMRLNIDDAFCAIDIGVFVGFTPTTGGLVSTATQQQQSILHAHPAAGPFQAADLLPLQQLYNGSISIQEGSTTWYEQIENYGFYRVGTIQSGLLLATGTSTTLRSSWEKQGYGMHPLTPNFALAGDRSYNTNLNMNTAAAFGALSGTNGQLWATIRLGGFFAAGGAKYIKDFSNQR